MRIEGLISKKDEATVRPPEHLPVQIEEAFREGATCLAVGCYNAAGTMFRLCVDLATRTLLPEHEIAGLNPKVRRDLGLRLPWLFTNDLLPAVLHDLSSCIKDDGNDGAHAGTLGKEDAEDMLDFTFGATLYGAGKPASCADPKGDKARRREETRLAHPPRSHTSARFTC